METKIELFVKTPLIFKNGNGYGNGDGYGYGDGNGDGNGYGYGNGYGDGNGYGNGYGDGNGDGNGYGNGYGDGNGDGNGYGLKSLNNHKVYLIDSIETIIINVKNNIAKAFIVNKDLTLNPCYIVKQNNYFSHGKTIKEAVYNLQQKLILKLPINERLFNFKQQFSDFNTKYKANELYNWHYLLTGSCDLGRQSFVKNNNINLEKDSFTLKEFINLTINNYGSDIITQLKKLYIK